MSNNSEIIYLAPVELAHLVPSPEHGVMVMLLILYAGIAPIGVVANTLVCVALIKSGLVKNSAYSMIFSLSMANMLYCLHCASFRTAGIILDR